MKTGNISTNKMEELLRLRLNEIQLFISSDYQFGCVEVLLEN